MLSHIHLCLALFAFKVAASNEDEIVERGFGDELVMRTSDVVAAGSPFTINVEFSNASWPNPDCGGPGNCSWSYFRTYLMADPNPTPGINFWRRYCYLSGCVSTDVTSFNATIPVESFPNGSPYTLDHELFNVDHGVERLFSPTFANFDGTIFNITNATGKWTEFAADMGNYGIENKLSSIPCDKVLCVEACQTKYIAPYVPYVDTKKAELAACIAECQKDVDPLETCIMKNATIAVEESPTAPPRPSASPEPTSTDAADPPSPTKPSQAAGLLPLMSWTVLSVLFVPMVSFLS